MREEGLGVALQGKPGVQGLGLQLSWGVVLELGLKLLPAHKQKRRKPSKKLLYAKYETTLSPKALELQNPKPKHPATLKLKTLNP